MEILFFCGRNKIIWKYCFLLKGYENTWQSLSVELRETTQMYNIKSADKKVTWFFVLWVWYVVNGGKSGFTEMISDMD